MKVNIRTSDAELKIFFKKELENFWEQYEWINLKLGSIKTKIKDLLESQNQTIIDL